MCEHAFTFDAVLNPAQPILAIRQCVDCRWWTKVWGAEFESPAPTKQQVLADVAAWKERREYAESHGLL